MSVETFSVEQVINITADAAAHFQNELQKKQASAVRISLKESGCTGFKYVIDEVDSGEAGDMIMNLDNGIAVYVDPKSLSALSGATIDLVQQGLNKNLVFDNPNVKDMCGCGESFSIDDTVKNDV